MSFEDNTLNVTRKLTLRLHLSPLSLIRPLFLFCCVREMALLLTRLVRKWQNKCKFAYVVPAMSDGSRSSASKFSTNLVKQRDKMSSTTHHSAPLKMNRRGWLSSFMVHSANRDCFNVKIRRRFTLSEVASSFPHFWLHFSMLRIVEKKTFQALVYDEKVSDSYFLTGSEPNEALFPPDNNYRGVGRST